MRRPESPVALARVIAPSRAERLERDLGTEGGRGLGVALGAAYPALRPVHGWQMDALERIARQGWRSRRSRAFVLPRLERRVFEHLDRAERLAELRRDAWEQRARIALRELLPRHLGGAPIHQTAAELANLAEATLEVALAEGRAEANHRFGEPLRADGGPSGLTVLGMGKLGGRELNAGSDIDLILIYDTDDGAAGEASLHEYWTLVARRAVEMLEMKTEDGFVWRVDLRLRPEGASGPLVYSLSGAERYYETWGRLWERAALLRARPVAGDAALGETFSREVVTPFVYRRDVGPEVAGHLAEMVQRSRTELKVDRARDLKLGRGGIREAEFFVQALQLIWGGREPSLRTSGTLAALDRLEAKGLVTDREAIDVGDAYVLLRRAEHAVQWASGVQTHSLPDDPEELDVLGRVLGFPGAKELGSALSVARDLVQDRFSSLLSSAVRAAPRFTPLLAALEHRSPDLPERVVEVFGDADLADHLLALARRPDDLLGARTVERHPDLADRVVEALRTSADPEQAALSLRALLSRFVAPDAYVATLADEPRALARLVSVFGASAFVGEVIAARPDLADVALFSQGTPSEEDAVRIVDQEVESFESAPLADAEPHERREAFIGALRRAQRRVTVEVAVSDLAGELPTRQVTRVLSALADRILAHALRWETGGDSPGLAVIAVGKLGGGDIGYGSDLDVLFIYDDEKTPEEQHAPEHFSRLAQRMIRLISEPHAVGPGYELDTRLRPSGSHGLLVTSLPAFARYHGVPLDGSDAEPERLTVRSSGAAWERQALLRARFCAGDAALGARAIALAHVAAYERGAPPAEELHHLRLRLEVEHGRERPGRFDFKVGRGGLLDVEFAAQWLQMRHGRDPRVRTTDVVGALHQLQDSGYLSRAAFESLRDGYLFLRRLEQRIRVVHGTNATVVDSTAAGLAKLARRMGIFGTPDQSEGEALLEAYADFTEEIRRTYLEVLGLPPE
ncbi:MAG TPA: bifunctional [glutamate--ammonia ligase]-adenylyl-L-tyrosine phosphorylase/[glutamate--ammonia-ligase] adenylyltransferase [Polyangiaceae bacterium]|nr:bifunctional [glutamate--ammonia ligase]-adenylyl-L-tyrosine phosphorylase/[glutamate--ammonia-ligase] adenylyltransferase [Polyangiaceae bacterium]